MKVTPFETYQTYLSVKNHFSNPKYDYFKYGGRSRAKIAAFNKRKDKYWLEKTSRKSDFGIPSNRFVFANFNNSYKITKKEFEVWIRVLKNVNNIKSHRF